MDLTLAMLPWRIIWKLKMQWKEKVGIALAMWVQKICACLGDEV
jgi:hypothetical protein